MNRFFFGAVLIVFTLLTMIQADAREHKHHHSHSNRDKKERSHGCRECNKVHLIFQKDIPLVITKPGEYCLRENITYTGSCAAITIHASDVKLHLNTFAINLTFPSGTGILVENASEIVIENDVIRNTSVDCQSGNGVHLVNTNKVLISNIFTENHFNGLLIQDSEDVLVVRSQFLNPVHSGATVDASTNVSFEDSVFAGSENNGLVFSDSNQDCEVIDCEFPNSAFTNLLVQQINGMRVENCSFSNANENENKINLVQFGDFFSSNQIANDVIFKGCTIRNRPSCEFGTTSPEGLALLNATGVLVDSCLIDIDNNGEDPDQDLSGIHISTGNGQKVGINITIRNTIVQGPATNGFYLDEGSKNIVIDDCLISGALKNGIFIAGTSASSVKNCTIVGNNTNGIFIGEESFSNAILNNAVINNGFNIIESLAPTGTGIGLASDSFNNLIQGNQVFNNAVNIQDLGQNNMFIDNTVFFNNFTP